MSEQRCIWCRQIAPQVTFLKEAHIVPQALGGKRTCPNVCDDCNAYFGKKEAGRASIEEAIKETFSITRWSYLHSQDQLGKNKRGKHYTSIFFKADFRTRTISVKPAYRLRSGFQTAMSRQFKRGIYKMFLETIEADGGQALDSRYDFIREYARYDLSEYPVFYFLRRTGIMLITDKLFHEPEVHLSNYRMKYLLNTEHFVEFEFLGHVLGIPISKRADIIAEQYFSATRESKHQFFCGLIMVQYFNDIDLTMNLFKDDGGYERWLNQQFAGRLLRF